MPQLTGKSNPTLQHDLPVTVEISIFQSLTNAARNVALTD